MTAQEKVRRDDQIVADRARGLRWSTIAARHRVSERHCRNIWNDALAATPLEASDAKYALEEAVAQLDAAIEELALLSEKTTNDSVRLGSIRSRISAMNEKSDLLRLSGFLPWDPQAARSESDLAETADQILQLLTKYRLPREAFEELAEALRVQNGTSVSASGG